MSSKSANKGFKYLLSKGVWSPCCLSCMFFLSPFLRLVSSVQAIMASSAGYIIACSCEDIIEDQWVSAEDMWQHILLLVIAIDCICRDLCFTINSSILLGCLFVFPCVSLASFHLCCMCIYSWEFSHFLWICSQMCRSVKVFPSLWVFLRMCYSSNAHLMSV